MQTLTPPPSLRHFWLFVAFTFLFSWALWIPAALSGQASTEFPTAVLYLLGGFGPSVVGVAQVLSRFGPERRREFWNRVVSFRRIPAWLIPVLLLAPAASFIFAVLTANALGYPSGPLETLRQAAANPAALIGLLVLMLVAGPLSEELGWRGYALDQLQARFSPLKASLLLGLVWWAWHLPLFFIRGTSQSQAGLFSTFSLMFLLGIFPLSLLLTVFYNASRRSILSAVLVHTAYNFTFNLVYPLNQAATILQFVFLLIIALLAWRLIPPRPAG